MKHKLLFLVFITAFSFYANAAPPVEEGKTIFTSRCGGCHNVNKLVVGPALAGVDQRHTIDWIVSFVQSSQTLVKSGDKQANELFTKFKVVMPDHKDLTADNIKSIVEYIKSSVVTESPKATEPEKGMFSSFPISKTDYGFFATLGVLLLLLVWSFMFLVKVKRKVRETLKR